MERRFVLALTLCLGVMFLWPVLFPSAPAKKPDARPVPGMPAAGGGADAPAPGPGASPPPPPPAPAAGRQQAARKVFVLAPATGEFAEVEFTSRGGAIRRITMRNDFEFSRRDTPTGSPRHPLDLILPVDEDLLTGAVSFDASDTEGMRTRDWTVDAQTSTSVAFSFLTSDGLRVRKTFTLPDEAQRYDLAVSTSVERVEGPPGGDRRSLRLLGIAGMMAEPGNHVAMSARSGAYGVQPVMQVIGMHDDPHWDEWEIERAALNAVRRETRAFRFAGVASSYFLAAVWSEGDKRTGPLVEATWVDGGDWRRRDDIKAFNRLTDEYRARGRIPAEDPELPTRLEKATRHFLRAWVEFSAAVGAPDKAAPSTLRIYAGPLSRRVLGADRYEALAPLVTYPAAPDFLARLLLFIFDLWNGLTGSAGLAILLMTLTVRGGLMPLSIRNQLGMREYGRKMGKLKPKLEVLKQRYGTNPRKFREEQQKLMREHGIRFPMGCLMMLLQIPIFFALFSSLRSEFAIRHEAFGWIRDLSGPDRLVDFGRDVFSFLPIPPGGLRGINLLPLFYIGITLWQQRLMPPPQDEQQAQQMKMAKWMSIIFSILLYNYTAALALYMCMSSLVALVESRIVRAKDQQQVAAAAVPPA